MRHSRGEDMPPNQRVRVLDAPLLARAVREWMAMARLTQDGAGKLLGVTRSQVSKLLRGAAAGVGTDTFARLAAVLPDQAALMRAVLTPVQAARLRQYGRWLEEHLEAAMQVRHVKDERAAVVAKRLREDARYAPCFAPLERAVGAGREDERAARLAVAEYYIVAPLVQHHASGGVERGVDDLGGVERGVEDLSEQELRSYLRAMVRAACILLARPAASERLQRMHPARRRRGERRAAR